MRLLPLVLLGLGAATCDGSEPGPTQNTYDHALQTQQEWRAQGNPEISHGCQLALIKLYVSYLPQAQVQPTCGIDAQLYGCLVGNTIVLDDALQGKVKADYVIEHELRHWFAACSMGTPDGAHAIDVVWYPYRGVDIRE